MNSHDSSLRFPSGRPIGSVKKDAKKLARSAGIPLTSALNRLAAENGIDLPWSEAVQRLKAPQTRPSEAKVFSIYGPDLANIRKVGIAAQKETGKQLELALYEAARDAGVDNSEEIATMAYKPIEKGTFHVAKIGGARLELWVSNGAFYDKTKRDLFINGGPIPGQAEKRRSDWQSNRSFGATRPQCTTTATMSRDGACASTTRGKHEFRYCSIPTLGLKRLKPTSVCLRIDKREPRYLSRGRLRTWRGGQVNTREYRTVQRARISVIGGTGH